MKNVFFNQDIFMSISYNLAVVPGAATFTGIS